MWWRGRPAGRLRLRTCASANATRPPTRSARALTSISPMAVWSGSRKLGLYVDSSGCSGTPPRRQRRRSARRLQVLPLVATASGRRRSPAGSLALQGMQSDAIVVQRTRSARSGCPASAGRHLSGADSRRDLPAEAVRQELQVDDGCHGPGEPLEEPTLPPPAQQDDALGLRAGWPRLESAAAHLRRSCQTPLGAPPSSLLDRGMGRRRCRAGTCLWANAIVNTPPVPVGKHTFVQWTIPGVGKPTTLRPGGGKAYPSATACARTLRSTSTAESGS